MVSEATRAPSLAAPAASVAGRTHLPSLAYARPGLPRLPAPACPPPGSRRPCPSSPWSDLCSDVPGLFRCLRSPTAQTQDFLARPRHPLKGLDVPEAVLTLRSTVGHCGKRMSDVKFSETTRTAPTLHLTRNPRHPDPNGGEQDVQDESRIIVLTFRSVGVSSDHRKGDRNPKQCIENSN
uniref:Uncharacterized protein n=1 Tax=Ananas comosus var. bracteatus TaxID=296719 RepID=A0A6V7NYD2_ANACO|nr:unnamed protein product [Ananas comosus var. bracteatus]